MTVLMMRPITMGDSRIHLVQFAVARVYPSPANTGEVDSKG